MWELFRISLKDSPPQSSLTKLKSMSSPISSFTNINISYIVFSIFLSNLLQQLPTAPFESKSAKPRVSWSVVKYAERGGARLVDVVQPREMRGSVKTKTKGTEVTTPSSRTQKRRYRPPQGTSAVTSATKPFQHNRNTIEAMTQYTTLHIVTTS